MNQDLVGSILRKVVSEEKILEINQSKTKMAFVGHVC
jgi:hypothetical protein